MFDHRRGLPRKAIGCVLLLAAACVAAELARASAIRRRAVGKVIWRPFPGISWQIQLQGAVDTSVEAQMYDIDGIDNDATTVAALHALGRKVVCYISAGSWESWRPDAPLFPASVIGKDYTGWPGEKWLDIRQIDLLAPILRARLDQCAQKGFDAVDADNVDGYQNDTGFPLSAADQLAFNRFLATEAHARRLSIGLKNDFDQVVELASDFDWALSESCFRNGECEKLRPFLDLGKAVFDIEYTEAGTTLDQFCAEAARLQISAILKHSSLDAWRLSCR